VSARGIVTVTKTVWNRVFQRTWEEGRDHQILKSRERCRVTVRTIPRMLCSSIKRWSGSVETLLEEIESHSVCTVFKESKEIHVLHLFSYHKSGALEVELCYTMAERGLTNFTIRLCYLKRLALSTHTHTARTLHSCLRLQNRKTRRFPFLASPAK
jgi:hypothetical protein